MLDITHGESLMLLNQWNTSSIGPNAAAAAFVNSHCELGDRWFWSNCVIKCIMDVSHRLMCVRYVLRVAINTHASAEYVQHWSENHSCSSRRLALMSGRPVVLVQLCHKWHCGCVTQVNVC